MSENIAELHKELIMLIDKLGITHIYSYDDQWGKYLSGELESYESKSLDIDLFDFFEKYSIDPGETANRIISNKGFTSLQELVDSGINTLNELISECLDKIKLKRENTVLKSLDLLFKELQSKGVTVEQRSEQLNKEDVSSVDGKILFLLDMNMEESSGVNDVVIESILEIKEARPHKFDIVIVYSHEKLDFYENQEAKAEYVEQYLSKHGKYTFDLETDKYLFLHQLWALSKTPNLNELSSKLVNTLLRAAFGHSLHDYLELKLKSVKRAMLELIKTNEVTFDFLFKDSFVEGEIFLDLLERTQKSFLNRVETEDLLLEEYDKTLNNLYTVSTLKHKRVLDSIVRRGLKKFRQDTRNDKAETGLYKGISEYGLMEYDVNRVFKDIMTGDVFKIVLHEQNIVKYGVLITTDCDLMVRFGSDYREIKRNVDSASLLLFDGNQMEHEISKKLINEGNGLWPVKDDTDYILLDTTSKPMLLNIDIRILDLCSLNRDGWAMLNHNKEEFITYKTYFFENYYDNNLLNWLNNLTNIEQYFPNGNPLSSLAATGTENSQEHTDESITLAKKEIFGFDTTCANQLIDALVGLKYLIKLNQHDGRFDIKRIGRLETKRTLQLIENNLNIISRIGVPTNPLA